MPKLFNAFVLLLAFAAVSVGAASSTERRFAVDFFPPLFSLSVSGGGEWVPAGAYGLGLWATGSISRGDSWLSDTKSDGESYGLGLTWRPSGEVIGSGLYGRYTHAEMRGEVLDSDDLVYPYTLSGSYAAFGYLSRGLWWKGFGYSYHLGIGVPVGDVEFTWDSPVQPEGARTAAKISRIMSCLDVGFHLQWAWPTSN